MVIGSSGCGCLLGRVDADVYWVECRVFTKYPFGGTGGTPFGEGGRVPPLHPVPCTRMADTPFVPPFLYPFGIPFAFFIFRVLLSPLFCVSLFCD